MDWMKLAALLVATVIVLSTAGVLVSLVGGLLATPRVFVSGTAALILLALFVGAVSVVGIRAASRTDTAYW